VTRVVYELDGVESAWASRRHRKPQRPGHGAGSSYRTRSWWIAVLFMIGSSCFAVGALPGYASLVGVGADGVTFFVGSIFFTSAAALQYVEAVNARRSVTTTTQRFRLVSWEPHRIDWLATAIQLIGTLFFNVSTFRAMVESFDAAPASLLSWRPDALALAFENKDRAGELVGPHYHGLIELWSGGVRSDGPQAYLGSRDLAQSGPLAASARSS
jgi:hypothetical protein